MTAPSALSAARTHRGLLALLVLWLLNLLRWHRATRPEQLPAPPVGSTTVLAGDGTRLHAQIGGVAEADTTIVFVHGFLARTLEFDMQWNHFSDKARLVRYDHRNHGRSERSAKQIDIDTLAGDLAEVIAATAPTGRLVLVGHSMGGMTILALALQSPALLQERVAGIGLIATGAGHYIDSHPVENAIRWTSRCKLLALHLALFRLMAPALEQIRPRRTRTMRWVTKKVMFGTSDVDPATLAMTHELLEEPPLSTSGSLQGALLRHDALRAMSELQTTPVVIVTGSADRLTRPEHSERMAADIGASATLVVVPGAGHVVNQTRPVETNAALDRLLGGASAELRPVA